MSRIKIKVSPLLVSEIRKTFKSKSAKIFALLNSLYENPTKGDMLAQIEGIQLRELKYDNVFRFYYFSNAYLVKVINRDELGLILLKFQAMSKKGKVQQKVIDKLKADLKKNGFDFF